MITLKAKSYDNKIITFWFDNWDHFNESIHIIKHYKFVSFKKEG